MLLAPPWLLSGRRFRLFYSSACIALCFAVVHPIRSVRLLSPQAWKAAGLGRYVYEWRRWAAGLELGCSCVVMMSAGNFNRHEVVVVSASPRRALIRELLRSTVWPFGSAVRSSIHVLAVDERG